MEKIIQQNEEIMAEIGKISCGLLHDLINPITGLTLYLETLEHVHIDKLIHPINEVSYNIRKFINVIQETIRDPKEIYVVNLYKVVNHTADLMRHKAITKDVAIVIAKNTENVLMLSNKLKVYQIVINLLTNALDAYDTSKNTAKRVISISITKVEKGLRLTVVDNACGIKKRDIKKIFNKDFSTKISGLGIGLHTVRNIVEKEYEGKIVVKSSKRKGTSFEILIPNIRLVSHQ